MIQPGDSRTCFVISPIGDDGSPSRALADDFLDLLVEPAVQAFEFVVVRADRIAKPTSITADIVRLVQESALCVVDLTGSNPNVFYELGRRHETGRPFVQLVRKGDEKMLPFDVAGIRTITYDVSDARVARDSVRVLQEYIRQLLAEGLDTGSGGESMGALARRVEHVDRKLDRVLRAVSGSHQIATMSSADDGEADMIRQLLQDPRQTFMDFLRAQRFDDAYRLLDRLKKRLGAVEFASALTLPTSMGHEPSFERLTSELETVVDQNTSESADDSGEVIQVLVEGIKNYFDYAGQAGEGIGYLAALYERLEANGAESKTRAFVANKVGMLCWVDDRFDECIEWTQRALGDEVDPAYLHNLGLVYEKLGMEADLESVLDQLQSLDVEIEPGAFGLLSRHGRAPGATTAETD